MTDETKHLRLVGRGDESNVTDINEPYREVMVALLVEILENIGEVENIVLAYTLRDGSSYVQFSPMTGATAAYLVKQTDAEFMANFMYSAEEE